MMSDHTSFRERLIEAFDAADIEVVPYTYFADNVRYVMVRPAGILNDRETCQVTAVNMMANYLNDPDEGLAEFANRVYSILRGVGINIVGSETVQYTETGADARGEFRAAILFTVTGTHRGLL